MDFSERASLLRSTARRTSALAVPSGRRRSSRRNPESLRNTSRSRMIAVCRSVRRLGPSFSSKTNAISCSQSKETTLGRPRDSQLAVAERGMRRCSKTAALPVSQTISRIRWS